MPILDGILYSLSLILVMLNNMQNMGSMDLRKTWVDWHLDTSAGFLSEQIK